MVAYSILTTTVIFLLFLLLYFCCYVLFILLYYIIVEVLFLTYSNNVVISHVMEIINEGINSVRIVNKFGNCQIVTFWYGGKV